MLIKLLLSQEGLDVNLPDNEGMTPLHHMAYKLRYWVNPGLIIGPMKLLLGDKRTNANVIDGRGDTPLHLACGEKNSAEIVSLLIKKGADVLQKQGAGEGLSPLHLAIEHGRDPASINLLIEADPRTLEMEDCNGEKPLHVSCRLDIAMAKLLLEKGADPNAQREKDGWTPLHICSESGQLESAKTLLSCGAKVHVNNCKDGLTPLHVACRGNHLKLAELLLEKGANPNAPRESNRWTPLHEACDAGVVDRVQFLLAKGADVNAESSDSLKPLHVAAKGNKCEVVWFLLRKYPSLVMEE